MNKQELIDNVMEDLYMWEKTIIWRCHQYIEISTIKKTIEKHLQDLDSLKEQKKEMTVIKTNKYDASDWIFCWYVWYCAHCLLELQIRHNYCPKCWKKIKWIT